MIAEGWMDVNTWITDNASDSPPVILVCGSKNAGKSTFGRYLVNAMLNRYDAVMHLECDVGQGEFTPPGTVALTKVTAPIMGPPMTHQKQSQRYAVY